MEIPQSFGRFLLQSIHAKFEDEALLDQATRAPALGGGGASRSLLLDPAHRRSWREVPERFGKCQTVYSQFRRWCRCGLWDALLRWFGTHARGVVLRFGDGSYITLHPHVLQGDASVPPRRLSDSSLVAGRQRSWPWRMKPTSSALCSWPLAISMIKPPRERCCRHWQEGILWAIRVFDSEAFQPAGVTATAIPRRGYQTIAEQPAPFDAAVYAQRHNVENIFQRLKLHKRLALRAEKTAS